MNTTISSRVAYSIVGVGVVLVLALVYLLSIQEQPVQTIVQVDTTQTDSLSRVNAYTSEHYGFSFTGGSASSLPQDFECNSEAPKYLFETTSEQYTYCQNSGNPVKVSLAWKKASLQKSAYLQRIANTITEDKGKSTGKFSCTEDKTYPSENGISGAISDCTISFPDGTEYYASAYFFYPKQYAEASQVLYIYSGRDVSGAESIKQTVRNIAREVVIHSTKNETSNKKQVNFLAGFTIINTAYAEDGGDGPGVGGSAGDSGDGAGDPGDSVGDGSGSGSGSSGSGNSCGDVGCGCDGDSGTGGPGSAPGDPTYTGFGPVTNNPVGNFTYIDGTWGGTGVMGGWACDADNFNTALTIQFYEGTTFLGSGLANSSWPAGQPSGACGGNPNHSFWIPLPDVLKTGTNRTVTAYANNIGPTGSINTNIGNQTVNVPLPPSVTTPLPGAVNGACGSAATNYLAHQGPSYPNYVEICDKGIQDPDEPDFPAQGGMSSWQCVGANGGTTAWCTATRDSAPAPVPTPSATAEIYANGVGGGTTISSGEYANISWGSTYASSCLVNPTGWTALNNYSGTMDGPLSATKTYTLTCDGVADSVTVTVLPTTIPPTGDPTTGPTTGPTINSERPLVRVSDPGNNVTLKYTTGTASPDKCEVAGSNGYNSGVLTLSAGSLYTRITAQTTFVINCDGLTDSVTVKIQPTTQEI